MSCGYCFDSEKCWLYCQVQAVEKPMRKGEHAVRDKILLAAEKLSEANDYLRIASEKLGGSPD